VGFDAFLHDGQADADSIGDMSCVIALLKDEGMAPARITLFFARLGLVTFAASCIWARMLVGCERPLVTGPLIRSAARVARGVGCRPLRWLFTSMGVSMRSVTIRSRRRPQRCSMSPSSVRYHARRTGA
jgi:hypothetical protein